MGKIYFDIYGDISLESKNWSYLSSVTAGAKGLKLSLFLITRFNFSFIEGSLGLANILLLPKALAPNSILPWNHATILPPFINFDTLFISLSSCSLKINNEGLYFSNILLTSLSENSGPK